MWPSAAAALLTSTTSKTNRLHVRSELHLSRQHVWTLCKSLLMVVNFHIAVAIVRPNTIR